MKPNTPIHLVKPKDYEILNDVYPVFDSKEKARQFVDKFKNRPDMEIIDGILNPDNNAGQMTAPYYISLAQTGSIPRDIFMCDYNLNLEKREDEYNICFYGGTKSSQGLFVLKTFAANQKEALKSAVRIRNTAIKNGEWESAWEKYKLQQSKLNFNTSSMLIR